MAGFRSLVARLNRGRQGRRALVREGGGAARGGFGRWHDRRLDAAAARAARADGEPDRERGERREPRRLRRHEQATGDDRMGMNAPELRALRALPLALALACAPAPPVASAVSPRLEATPAGVRWHGASLGGRVTGAARPVAAWWAAARDSGLAGTAALVPLADQLADDGDTLRADSLLRLP